jgi:hypothetical protein
MSGIELYQRCWNHDAREAACRCPACGRPFCRECVSEHEARLLCAACLSAQARARLPRRRRFASAAYAITGMLLAWMLIYGAGRTLVLIAGRMQEAAWEER